MTIERSEFQRLLFRTAFCVMACDGNIDEREIREMKSMNKSAAFFQGIDLTNELDLLLTSLRERGKQFVNELIESLNKVDLSTVQELLILEVAFRIVNADEKVDENEINFVKFLRSKLNVYDEIIRDRFGVIEYLFDKEYARDLSKDETREDNFTAIKMPELKDLEAIDFSTK